jgi:Concanavalin A-like lectin/glucanases superfamily
MVYDFGAAAARSCGVTLNDNKWHLVTATFKAGTSGGMRCYSDGNLVSVNTISIVNQSVQIMIGEGNANQYFNGLIDDVRVYNRVLSDAEVKQLYNAGR